MVGKAISLTIKNKKPMITRIGSTTYTYLFTLALISVLANSCTKESSQSTSSSQTSSSTIAVASFENSSVAGDSIYVIQPCPRGYSRVSITEAQLPSAATAYLSSNYSGFTFNKAFVVVNSTGQTAAYVAVIYYDNKPVAILFDSNGNFVRVLEQRDKEDIDGKGWHDGGRFCDRDGLQKDTLAPSSLPVSVLTYMTTNYSTDTLLKAFEDRHDSGFVVISKNNGLFATVFNENGIFVKRVAMPTPPGTCMSISETALPASIVNYLTETYPDYVFEKAFAAYNSSNMVQGYAVVINANNTRYAVLFDGSGNFVAAKAIW
jgi:putative PepSY-like beta-lactamase-inhibitor